MRYLLPFIASIAGTAACAGVPPSGPPHYDSVRERLSDVPTWLYVHDEASSGALTARRSAGDGWITSTTQLRVERGYVRTAIDDSGQLVIDQLEIIVAPFTMDRMFERPARLQDVSLRLAEPVRVDAAWASDDDATATLPIVFDVGAAIAFDGGAPHPLATQHVPAQSVELVLAGTGDHVDATLDLHAAGELWNCDGSVQITEVSLSLGAETAD